MVGFSLTGLGIWGVAAGGGLIVGRRWARRSAMFVFSAWAVLVSALFVVTAVDDQGLPLGGVLAWFLIAGFFVAIVILSADLPQQWAP